MQPLNLTPTEKPTTTDAKQRKLTFYEKRELETLEKDIQTLEEEQQMLEAQLSSGALSTEEIMTQSKRFSKVSDLLDEKTMRWLELSELAN